MAFRNAVGEADSPRPILDKTKPLPRGHRLSHVDELLSEYPGIAKHMGDFRVHASAELRHGSASPRNLKDSIVVFKKKRLLQQDFQSNTNIYECYSGNLELDVHDQKKSRTSCQRCRRYKKKCTRDLPECLNCASCEEMCYYTRRKKKAAVEAADSPGLPACAKPSPLATYSGVPTCPDASSTHTGVCRFPDPSAAYPGGSTFSDPSTAYSGGSTCPDPSTAYSGGSTCPDPSTAYSGGSTCPDPSTAYSGGSTCPDPPSTYSGVPISSDPSSAYSGASPYGVSPYSGVSPFSEPDSYLHRQAKKFGPLKSESPRTHALYLLGSSNEHQSAESISSSVVSLNSEINSLTPKSLKSQSPTSPRSKESSIHWLLN